MLNTPRTHYLSECPVGRRAPKKGLGYLTQTGALYLGPSLDASTHVSHAYKIYVALHGEFDLVLGGSGRVNSLRSVVIAPDRPHRLMGGEAVVALYYLIPETAAGQLVSKIYGGREAFALPETAHKAVAPRLRQLFEHGGSEESARAAADSLVRELLPASTPTAGLDARVVSVLDHLSSALEERVTIKELAYLASLSPGRLEHLFAEQIGIPISRYLLWRRLQHALGMMPYSSSLTEVAHASGFADLAHFSRTFRRMLGLSPSTIRQVVELHPAHPA